MTGKSFEHAPEVPKASYQFLLGEDSDSHADSREGKAKKLHCTTSRESLHELVEQYRGRDKAFNNRNTKNMVSDRTYKVDRRMSENTRSNDVLHTPGIQIPSAKRDVFVV